MPICRDTILLRQKSIAATYDDTAIIRDLKETLTAHLDSCVGMAANMIGVSKRVIAVAISPMILVMVNPEILNKADAYEAEEDCLSLTGTRKTTRWESIDVKWLDESFKPRRQTFTGWTAQIIQHEVDHCNGVLI